MPELLLCKLRIKWRFFKRRVLGIPLHRTPKIRELKLNEEYTIHGDELFIITRNLELQEIYDKAFSNAWDIYNKVEIPARETRLKAISEALENLGLALENEEKEE